MPGRHTEPQGGLWVHHLSALDAFLALAGQWRCVAHAGGRLIWTGLDYAAAPAAFDLAGITVSPAVWQQVRTIEAGALEEMNRER